MAAPAGRDAPLLHKNIPLTGQYMTSVDPAAIGENFKDLSNFRYTDTGLKPIQGMTKMNAAIMNATYFKPRSAYHLNKFQPQESHLLVQAWNAGLTASQILENTTAIGSTGTFSATPLYTESSGASRGLWATAPQGAVIYCNGKESLIYGGTESRVGGFINYNSNGSFFTDYTDEVNDTLNTTGHVATLAIGSASGIDSNVSLLLHCDGTNGGTTFTDSSTATPKTVTAHGNAKTDTSQIKFGTASGSFDGTNSYLSTPDHADFDFSGGNWTVDCWIRQSSLVGSQAIYSQYTDANNNFLFQCNAGGLTFSIVSGGSTVVLLQTSLFLWSVNTWHHVAAVEDGDNYYLFLDGKIVSSTTAAGVKPANYTGTVQIGAANAAGDWFDGWIDEIRVSKTTRWVANFSVPVSAYGSSNVTQVYLGSTRPLQGLKLYVGTPNTATSALAVYVWEGDDFSSVTSLVDGTSVGGKSLAQTGSVTFDSTDGSATVHCINERVLYWYKLEWTANVDATTTIYYVTVHAPMQTLKDIWDGTDRTVAAFLKFHSNTYYDYSTNVFKADYDSTNTATYGQSGSLVTGTDYLIAGFTDRMQGIRIYFVEDKVNVAANTTMTVSHWDGSAWSPVVGLEDQTMIANVSFAKSGVVCWTPENLGAEVKYEGFGQINKIKMQKAKIIYDPLTGTTTTVPERPVIRIRRMLQKDLPAVYFYKISFSKTLSADIRIDYIGGIPAQQNPSNFRGCFASNERVFLYDDQSGERNRLLSCNLHGPDVWNGNDSIDDLVGDERPITAGACLDLMGQNGPIQLQLVTKHDQTFIVSGNAPDTLTVNVFAQGVGCVAPATMQVMSIGGGQNPGDQVAIWESGDGIYRSNGGHPECISDQIYDLWRDGKMEKTMVPNHSAFVDNLHHEYHWQWASLGSTILDKEYVYDVRRNKWFPVVRSAPLQCGVEAHDTNQTIYTYGFIETGYAEQLESGTTMDGTAITSMFETGDNPLRGLSEECEVVRTELIGVAKSTTTNLIQGSYYGDTSNTPESFTMSPKRTNHRLFDAMDTMKHSTNILHRWKFSLTTSNETYGFEPLILSCLYQPVRPHTKGQVM